MLNITKIIIMKKKIIGYIGMAVFAIAIAFNLYMTSSNTQTSSVVLENIEALADSTSGSGSNSGDYLHPDTQEIPVDVEETVYKKWDAEAGIWIFSSVGGEGWTKITTSYTYKCCYTGGPGCNYGLCPFD